MCSNVPAIRNPFNSLKTQTVVLKSTSIVNIHLLGSVTQCWRVRSGWKSQINWKKKKKGASTLKPPSGRRERNAFPAADPWWKGGQQLWRAETKEAARYWKSRISSKLNFYWKCWRCKIIIKLKRKTSQCMSSLPERLQHAEAANCPHIGRKKKTPSAASGAAASLWHSHSPRWLRLMRKMNRLVPSPATRVRSPLPRAGVARENVSRRQFLRFKLRTCWRRKSDRLSNF